MTGIGIGLQEVLQRALTFLHHGGHDGDIRDLGPRKGLITILTGILPKTRGIRTTITRLDLLNLRRTRRGLRIVLFGDGFLHLVGLIGDQRGCRGCRVMFTLQLGDILQRNVFTDLQHGTLGARMLKQLRGSRLTADLQLKGLTQVVCKPRALGEFLLVIRNIHHVLLGHTTVHSLDLREMGASRLGKN